MSCVCVYHIYMTLRVVAGGMRKENLTVIMCVHV